MKCEPLPFQQWAMVTASSKPSTKLQQLQKTCQTKASWTVIITISLPHKIKGERNKTVKDITESMAAQNIIFPFMSLSER